jgi:hypothetical protein
MTFTLAGALAEIQAALPKVFWYEFQAPFAEGNEARGLSGEADGWKFVLFVWRILPESTWGSDGTATKGGLVMRLTPELAKLAGDLATKEL